MMFILLLVLVRYSVCVCAVVIVVVVHRTVYKPNIQNSFLKSPTGLLLAAAL